MAIARSGSVALLVMMMDAAIYGKGKVDSWPSRIATTSRRVARVEWRWRSTEVTTLVCCSSER